MPNKQQLDCGYDVLLYPFAFYVSDDISLSSAIAQRFDPDIDMQLIEVPFSETDMQIIDSFDCVVSYDHDRAPFVDDDQGTLVIEYSFQVVFAFKSEADMEAAKSARTLMK